jgi:hypothetical protein
MGNGQADGAAPPAHKRRRGPSKSKTDDDDDIPPFSPAVSAFIGKLVSESVSSRGL